jgi:hypothetical protein
MVVVAGAGCSSGTITPGGSDLAMLPALPGSDFSVGDFSVGDAAGNHPGSDFAVAASGDMATSPATGCAHPPCLNVTNACPFPLWIHANNNAAALTPDNAELIPGGTRQYDVPASWPGARVNAYWVDPTTAGADPQAFDKVELTVGGGSMNYNITYVDYLALPVRMEAIGPSCTKTATFDPAVACAVPVGMVLSGCPAGLLDGRRCLSAGLYCSIGANQTSAFCHALDGTLQSCETANPGTCGIASQLGNGTPQVYGCSGYFDSQPANCSPPSTTCHLDGNEWCAALNRGMLAAPTSADTTLYYTMPPYNPYAKWVHETCPGIYAFPYDDFPSTAGAGGFRSCTADRIDITFCPGG